jgi:hypothetical protein
MRSIRANNNLLAVSAYGKETAINTEHAFDISLPVDMESIITLDQRREDNSNEATGMEEPDAIYDNGALSQAQLSFSKAQPQHFAFVAGYALGTIASTAAGTGYLHTITPIDGEEDANRSVPSFSAMQRLGEVLKRRFVSMFVDSFTATFAKDDWVKLVADVKGTGRFVDNVIEDTLSAPGNAVSLTLATNGVQGATAQERLDNVQRIRCELTPGVWTEVVYSAVSAVTPAVITITSPGGTVSPVNYKILYVPIEAAAFTFPAKLQETPLRVAQLTVNMGGTWNGTAFAGGRALSSEVNSLEWKFQNNLEVEFVPGAGGAYAASCYRPGRTQTVTLDRKMMEFIIQQHVITNDTFGLRILCEGALYDATNKYQVEIIFPKIGVLKSDPKVDNKRNTESAELQVLQDATYGSVIVKVKNLQAAYAA